MSGRGVGLDVVREAASAWAAASRCGARRAGHDGRADRPDHPRFISRPAGRRARRDAVLPLDAVRERAAAGTGGGRPDRAGPVIVHDGQSYAASLAGARARCAIRRRHGRRARHGRRGARGGAPSAAFGVDRILGTRRSSCGRCRSWPASRQSSPARPSTPRATRSWCSIPTPSCRAADGRQPASDRERDRPAGPGGRRLADDPDAGAEHPGVAGYDVDLAVSGEEASRKAATRSYALFLVDVEMPGMDGFTFVEHDPRRPALRDIPSILVTSRSAPDDQRGAARSARRRTWSRASSTRASCSNTSGGSWA